VGARILLLNLVGMQGRLVGMRGRRGRLPPFWVDAFAAASGVQKRSACPRPQASASGRGATHLKLAAAGRPRRPKNTAACFWRLRIVPELTADLRLDHD